MYVIFHLFLFVYIIPCYAFLSYHVPMFSLLMYFLRNDKNKGDQSINLLLSSLHMASQMILDILTAQNT